MSSFGSPKDLLKDRTCRKAITGLFASLVKAVHDSALPFEADDLGGPRRQAEVLEDFAGFLMDAFDTDDAIVPDSQPIDDSESYVVDEEEGDDEDVEAEYEYEEEEEDVEYEYEEESDE